MATHSAHVPAPAASVAPVESRPRRERAKRVGARGALYSVATFFTLFAALPFAWMILTIFKADSDFYKANNNPFLYNDPPTLSNLDRLFNDTDFLIFVRNSFVVALATVIITILFATPAAYSLTRLSGAWGEGLGIGIFLVYLVPPTLLFIPMTRI